MRAWLSGVLINQNTCQEGFDGTNSTVEIFAGDGLNKITSSVDDILSMVRTTPDGTADGSEGGSGGRNVRRNDKFPDWLESYDGK